MRVPWSAKLATGIFLFLFALTLSAQSAREPINSASTALRAGKYDEALSLLEPALRQFPSSFQLWTLQGLAYSKQGHKEEALAAFRHASKISPDYLPALEGAAQAAYETGASDTMALLQHVLKLAPGDPTAHAMLAALEYRDRNCADAVSHFQQSGALLKSQPIALRQYGICLGKLKRYEQAIGIFQELVAMPGDDPQDSLRLAALQLSSGKTADAIDSLAPALNDHPNSDVLALASQAYEEQKDTPKAVELLHQAIVQDPRNTDLYLQFADLSMVHQSFQVGVDMMSAGLKLQPDSSALYLGRGILYVQLADYDRAEADLEKANLLDPQHSVSEAALGMEAEQKNDLDKALAVVGGKLKKQPDDPLLLSVQADILVQKNPDADSVEFKKAVTSAKRAVQLKPDLVAARDTLAKLYLQADKNQLAIEESRTSMRYDPNDQVALYHLITGLRRTGQKDELPALLQKLADLRRKATREEGEHNRYKLIEPTESDAPAKH
jgi:tetratricopeptide (TPR) repeat protein